MHATYDTHVTIDPAILYIGTPVALVSSMNPDGTPNLAPMSSARWLGLSCMLGFGARSHTPANIQRMGECVLSHPSVHADDLHLDRRHDSTLGRIPESSYRPRRAMPPGAERETAGAAS